MPSGAAISLLSLVEYPWHRAAQEIGPCISLSRGGEGEGLPMVKGPPALSCARWRHYLGYIVGFGVVQPEHLWLLGQLGGLNPVLGLGRGGKGLRAPMGTGPIYVSIYLH